MRMVRSLVEELRVCMAVVSQLLQLRDLDETTS